MLPHTTSICYCCPRYPEGELPPETAAALADAQHLVRQATDRLDQVDTEALSVRARIALLQGDLDHDKAAQAAGKVRDHLARALASAAGAG